METSITIERLADGETEEYLPSHEILRENLKAKRRRAKKMPKEFKCDICHKVFTEKAGLTNHKTTHQTDYPYQCEQCSYRCKNRKYLSRHVLKVHNKSRKNQICKICGKCFFFKCNLDAHIRTHTGEKPYKCDVCGHGFNSSYSLKTHKLIHTNEKPFKCSFCEYACRDSSTLRKHHSSHLGIQKKYKCEKCTNGYNTKSRLMAHMTQKHSGETRILSCDSCDTKFKNKWTLVKHIKTVHEKANSCTCGICGRHISNSDNLKAHLRVHIDARPFKCSYAGCNKKFKDNNCLKKHSVLHYPSQQMCCPDCGRRFARRHRFTEHLQRQCGGVCSKNYHRKNKKVYGTLKERDPNREKLICDTCSYKTTSKSKLIKHIQYGHGSIEDLECKICWKTFRKNDYLKLHYWNMHKVKYKAKIIKIRPMVVIKQEPLDDEDLYADMEIDLLDIDKEEPFAGFGTETESAFEQEGVITENPNEEETRNELEKNAEEEQEAVENTISDKSLVLSEPTESQPERPSIQMSDFIQHIILAEQSDEEIEKEDSERYVQKCLRELMQKANKKNAIRLKNTVLGKKLKKIEDEEASKLILKTNRENEEESLKEVESNQEVTEARRKNREKRPTRKQRSGSKGKRVQYLNQKTKTTKDSETGVNEKDSNNSKNGSLKIKFNIHQCYVCYKLFKTKPDLIEHCKIHFDVCNEVTLKKCPLCPYVTPKDIKRHVRLVHKTNINFSFMRIKDKIDNHNGSRYYFDIHDNNLKKMEIVPSIKILNKKACMEIDKKNREKKNKSVLKRKLVKKGKEWVVEHEKLDLSDRVIPDLKEKDNYLESLRKLNVENKKKGIHILFPCNVCDKVCQNLSALTLHLRAHDPNAKPFKPKVWKHKTKEASKCTDSVKDTINFSTENRTAKPKPIVTRHRCDPKLKDFYEKNIKGGDIEFWQFLKIYNKMSRENVNDFKDLEARTEFGMHFNAENVNNNDNDEDIPLNELLNHNNDKTTAISEEINDKNKKETILNEPNEVTDINEKETTTNKRNSKIKKGIRRNVKLSKRDIELRKIRNAAKAKLRENITNSIT